MGRTRREESPNAPSPNADVPVVRRVQGGFAVGTAPGHGRAADVGEGPFGRPHRSRAVGIGARCHCGTSSRRHDGRRGRPPARIGLVHSSCRCDRFETPERANCGRRDGPRAGEEGSAAESTSVRDAPGRRGGTGRRRDEGVASPREWPGRRPTPLARRPSTDSVRKPPPRAWGEGQATLWLRPGMPPPEPCRAESRANVVAPSARVSRGPVPAVRPVRYERAAVSAARRSARHRLEGEHCPAV